MVRVTSMGELEMRSRVSLLKNVRDEEGAVGMPRTYILLRADVSDCEETSDIVCIRHLTSSVGQRASEASTAAKLPAAIFSTEVN